MEIVYPEQAHYNLEFAKKAFDIVKPKVVTEIGGWKGDLAYEILKDSSIEKWYNIEISQNAIDKTKCKDQRHEYIKPDSFNWFDKIEMKGMIVSTHFIEHLSNQNFETLCKFIKEVEYIYFEAPLENDGQTWENYVGTHILTYGWNKVKELLHSHEVILENNYCKLFKKR